MAEWTAERLAIWLDRQNHDAAFSQSDMLNWTTELVRYLIQNRNFTASQLYRLKFILSRKVSEKISTARKIARDQAHQKLLFSPQARVELSLDFGFKFFDGMYFGQAVYNGPYKFGRNFLGPRGVGAFDGQRNSYGEGEEFDCAKMLDSLPQVKHWVRNIARHPNSFKLPMAHNNFYPDFVAELVDGRIFIVEYKGGLTIHEAHERRTIGEKWEQASKNGDLFMIVELEKDGLDMRAQLLHKLGAS